MSKPKYNHAKLLTLSAVLCALVFVATAYLPRIPIPANMGYVHIGDAFIFLAAVLLPTPYACAVGAIGAGLADAVTGFMLYVPATLIIKALYAPFFSSKKNKFLSLRNIVASLISGGVCTLGYYLYEAAIYTSFAVPVANIPFNLAQGAASAIMFIIIAFLFDRFKLREQISR